MFITVDNFHSSLIFATKTSSNCHTTNIRDFYGRKKFYCPGSRSRQPIFKMKSKLGIGTIKLFTLVNFCSSAGKPCYQIGRNLDIRATLGYFLPNKFSQTQAVSTDGLL